MNKYLVLEEGADCIIMSNTSLSTMKTIPYDAITGLSKHDAPIRKATGEKGGSDFIIIKADGRETVINFDTVLLPLEDNVDDLFEEIWSWVYTDAAPTPTPTPTPTT